MKEILNYLNQPIDSKDVPDIEGSGNKELERSYNKLSTLFTTDHRKESQIFIESPTSQNFCQGQIWLTHKTYIDYIGNIVDGHFPFYVYIEKGPISLGDLSFIRVQPISSFLEFASIDDIVVENNEITGFQFFIETWNDQPVSLDVLGTYIGEINIAEYSKNKTGPINESHKNFRKIEIENTSYLRRSVISYLEWEQNCQSENSGIVLNAGNMPVFPINEQPTQSQPQYLYAAKKGIESKAEYYTYNEQLNGELIEITIKKDENYFTILIKYESNIMLKNIKGDEMGDYLVKNGENTIYEELPFGMYQLFIRDNEESIKIRVG